MLLVLYSSKFFTVFNESCTRSAARDWNNTKRFSVRLVKVRTGFTANNLRNHTFMTSTRKVGLVISPVFADSVVFK